MGLNPETGRGKGTVTAVEVDFERNTSAQPLDPRQGYVVNGHVEKAGQWLRGTFDYTEFSGEVRGYVPIGSRFVWANRVGAGTLAGPSAALIPFYKRYFVGGSSSVRGWGRYQVSPLTPDGQPIGGRTMMEVSTEARFGIRGKLGGVLFVDGGNAWEGPWEVQLKYAALGRRAWHPLRHAHRPDAGRPWHSTEPYRRSRARGESGEAEVASTLQHRPGVLGVGGSAMRALRRLSRYVAIAVLSLVILLGAGVAVTQTSWFKNWLRQKAVSQAAQYLNGELTITRLSGNVFTGVALEGVALRHEGQTAVAMDKLSVEYSPMTMISDGVIIDSMTLDNPTILLQRDDAGWNFNRFVKTRRNTGGRGAPPITMESIAISNGHSS